MSESKKWSPDSLPYDQLKPVNAVSEAFALFLITAPAPRIEPFLERPEVHEQTQAFSPAQWSALVYYLVQEEFEFRGRDGKVVDDDYERRFPRFASAVRAAIDERNAGLSSVRMPPTPAQARQVLGGRYELEELLSNKGASSEVWLGLVRSTQGRVAIKLAKPGFEALVEGEISAWRSVVELNHPNVVKFIDCGKTDNGRPYLVMEFIPGDTSARRGRTLSDWIKSQTKIDFKVCCELMAGVAETIHHVHEQGVLHLDIKPDNILLNHRNQPFLSDFGLAQRMTDGRVALRSFCGSPAYAAPEASRDRDGVVTARSDVFSLVAVLAELVAGVKPFTVPGDFSGDSTRRHRELRRLIESGSANKLPDNVPDVIARIIRRGLDKTPDRRFATAEDLVQALRVAAEICGIEENAPPPFSSLPSYATPRFWEPPLLFERIDSLFDDYRHVALCGQPGLGKTLLSSEYARRREKKYRYRLFAQATTDETLVTQLGRPDIARQLGLAVESGESPQSIAGKVRDRLSQLSGWLLVFDDVPDTDADFQRVRQWLPSTERGGRVLISTTREVAGREVGGLFQVLPIEEWRPKDAVRFLLKGLDHLPDGDLDHADPTVRSDAETLERELGGRPLALESAIQYMIGGRVRVSLREYLELWRNHPRKLAEKGASNPTNHASEAVTFDLLWDSIRYESPVAADLIRLTAVLAHAPLPVIALQTYAATNHGHDTDGLDWRESFAVALRMLRQPNEDSVTLHSLHRTLVRNEWAIDGRQSWLNVATESLADAFPDSADRSQWSRCDAILPHVDQLLAQIDEIDEKATTARLVGTAALFRDRQALEEKAPDSPSAFEAERLYRRALELDPNHANNVGNFANFLRTVRQQHDEAERLYRRALELDPNHANNVGNFANFLTDVRQQHDEAERLYRRALELDPNHANNVGNFANFLRTVRQQHDEAERLYRRALELDPNHANHVGNFALFLRTVRQQHDEAERLYRRALELDPNHANHVGNFASFLTDVRQQHDEAERLYRRALELDPNHANHVGNFALFLTTVRRKHDEAERLYRRALELDPNHANNVGNFANFLRTVRQQHDEAERLYRRALELDPNHANHVGNFANFLTDVRQQHDEAERLYLRTLELDPNHANHVGNFAGFLVVRKRLTEAREMIARFDALEVHEVSQVVAEVELYRVVICRARRDDDTPYLVRLKRMLAIGYVRGAWSFDSQLAVLKEFVAIDEPLFYEMLAAAILDETHVPQLDEFPRWRELPDR